MVLRNARRGNGEKMNIEKQIELDKIKELWMELAVTEWAKEKIKDTSFSCRKEP